MPQMHERKEGTILICVSLCLCVSVLQQVLEDSGPSCKRDLTDIVS